MAKQYEMLANHWTTTGGLLKKPDRLRRSLFQRSELDKLAANVAVEDDCYCQTPQMYRKHHNGQLSIEDFHVPFGGTLDPDNRG